MATPALDAVRTVCFGPYQLDLDQPQLRKHGVKIKLQGQPLRLLVALVENRGRAVSRSELQRLLWPADTYVDFETGINNAIKRLRAALNDSAENSLYIETLAGEGYRFIAPLLDPSAAAELPAEAPHANPSRRILLSTGAVAAAGALWWTVRPREAKPGEFHAITFRRGFVGSARFGPDGQTVLYSAVWDTQPRQTFMTNGVSPESRALGFTGLSFAAVSSKGDLAFYQSKGTSNIGGSELATAPMSGGIPHVVERNIMTADWSADGTALAVARAVDGVNQLEFPAGKVLHRTSGWISSVRVLGSQVAFFEHPVRHDDRGTLMLAADGGVHALGTPWASARGLAWHPSGEIWFTASNNAAPNSLWAMDRSGRLRALQSAAGSLHIWDVSRNGRVLLTREERRLETEGHFGWSPEGQETQASWLDWSRAVALSANGDRLLFDEDGPAVAGRAVSFVVSGKGTVRLGDGVAQALSPDGEFALLLNTDDRGRLFLMPLDGGKPIDLPRNRLSYQWAKFFPDGRNLLALASEPAGSLRLFRVPLDGGAATPVTPPGMVRHSAISADGSQIAILDSAGRLVLLSARGGEPEVVPAKEPLGPVQWTPSGLYLQQLRGPFVHSCQVLQLDLRTRQFRPWRRVAPRDPLGVDSITRVLVASGENTYAYSYRRVLSELFSLDGLR